MRNLYVILLILLILSNVVLGQIKCFDNFIENFKTIDIPITIDGENYRDLFYFNNSYKEINSDLINLFILQNDEVFDDSKLQYYYGLKIELNKNFKYCIVHKQNYEGNHIYDFDLSETILFVFNNEGMLIANLGLGKDSDGWISYTSIDSTLVKVKQVKVLEFNRPQNKCEIINYTYKLNNSGTFDLIDEGEKYYDLLVWNEKINNFELLKNVEEN